METKVNYTLVGLFVLMLTTLLVAGGFWLSTARHSREYKNYVIHMNESVYGLSEQAPVKFNGVTIGYVDSINLNPHNLQQVTLLLKIENNIPITDSTIASLKSQGITGMTYIGLEAKTAKALPLRAKAGEKYPEIPSQPSFLVQLGDTLRDVSVNITRMSNNVQKMLDDDNTQAIKTSLHNMATFSKALAQNSQRIDKSLRSAQVLFANSAKVSKRLPAMAAKVDSSLNAVNKMTADVSKASRSVNTLARDSRTAIQVLSQQAIPDAMRLIHRLDLISENVQQITDEIQQNPSIIIRGKRNTSQGPGE